MIQKIREVWKSHGFEITLGLAVVFILVMSLLRRGKKGTWNTSIAQPLSSPKTQSGNSRDSKGEVECRRVLEQMFRKPFHKARPDFLRNPVTSDQRSDNNLELDCYNPELRLAVEYNGIQHYKYVPYFHKSRDAFQNQKYRDHMKRDLCEKNGITLIEVPYTVKVPDIHAFLVAKLSPKNK